MYFLQLQFFRFELVTTKISPKQIGKNQKRDHENIANIVNIHCLHSIEIHI